MRRSRFDFMPLPKIDFNRPGYVCLQRYRSRQHLKAIETFRDKTPTKWTAGFKDPKMNLIVENH